jgi:hypothetical protein
MAKLEIQTSPAEPVIQTPEQAALNQEKLDTMRANRKARKAQSQKEDPSIALADIGKLPKIDLPEEPQEDSEPQEAPDPQAAWPEWNGQKVSPKFLAMKQAQGHEAEARGQGHEAEPVDQAAYDEALKAYQAATDYVHALQAELADIPGRVQDLAQAGDYEQLASLRQREAELPYQLEGAQIAQAKAKVAYYQLKSQKARAESIEKSRASTQVSQEFLEWQAKQNASHMDSEQARSDWYEARSQAGAAVRELEALLASLAERKPAPVHRAPKAVGQGGVSLSGLLPLNQRRE